MANGGQRWIIASFDPVCLFSLRMANTTSKGGKTLLAPTPYAVKMALIDACFRAGDEKTSHDTARRIFENVKRRRVRFLPPPHCVVQNTFVKVLDAERDGDLPFKQTIVYREFVHFSGGALEIAIDATGLDADGEAEVSGLLWHINSLGKRGSFWQCLRVATVEAPLVSGFTADLSAQEIIRPEHYGLIQPLDDFGEALCDAKDGFERISSYGTGTIALGKHRVLVSTGLPYRMRTASKRFTWYERPE